MLKAFEHWFGPYPFYEDGYKLVEVPYLGMEHQSSVTYGNKYQNGYLGKDLSKSGWGLKFDFIIVHESGHEWFANNITYKDIADMWIHESFTAYSENLFLDYYFGKKASSEYVIGTRANIQNDRPIIGLYDVNYSGSGDMYYKGANMLHTLRQIVNSDAKWRTILRGLNKTFYHQTVTTAQIEDYLSKQVGRDLNPFFNQYLRDIRIPVLEYELKDNKLQYRWVNVVAGFNMPVKVYLNDKEAWLEPTTNWQTLKEVPAKAKLKVDPNFYVTASDKPKI
jgi:aminopeptidase N